MSGDTDLTADNEEEDGRARLAVCRVCHLEYEGDECPWCKEEREHASGVIEQRGRRSRRAKEAAEDSGLDQ